MLEEYVLKKLESLEKENTELKAELEKKNNAFLQLEERDEVKLELIGNESLFQKIEEAGFSLKQIEEDMGVNEIANMIKELNLYKEVNSNNHEAVIRVNNKCYGLLKYYDEYRFDDRVYVDLDEAIRCELVDKLYDKVRIKIKNTEAENET